MSGDWRLDALCRDAENPDLWFASHNGEAEQIDAARRICRECPVALVCLEFAMRAEADQASHLRHGIYGGYTPCERARLARRETATVPCRGCGQPFHRVRTSAYCSDVCRKRATTINARRYEQRKRTA